MKIGERIRHAWNVFTGRSDVAPYTNFGSGYFYRPDRPRLTHGNDRSIVTSVLNRISMDAATIDIKHVQLDDSGRYLDTIDSSWNRRLNLEANIDQTGRAFRQDAILSMLDEGCIAIVPVDTDISPSDTESYKVESIRVGKIVEWFPKHVRVRLYNDRTGDKEEVVLKKTQVGIVENPLYPVMNEPSSTMQRLMRKLAMLDSVDEQATSGRLNLVIQLPYVVKGELRKAQAEDRQKELVEQLVKSPYGVGYIDGSEKVIQLNRAVDNNLMDQIKYLTSMLYSQLGITQEILDGTADEKTMLNYYNRTIEPIVSAIVEELNRKFLTQTARTQGKSFMFFRDPFKLVPVSQIAEIADKMTRNEIMTSNEIRQIIGLQPSKDPGADELRNKNLYVDEKQNTENVSVDESINEENF